LATTNPSPVKRVTRQYRFGDFALDLESGFLRRNGEPIELRPKPFELLVYLVERNGRLVSKDELIDSIWPGVAVTDNSLAQSIAELRRLLGDSGRDMIRTVPRRGYVFATPVEREAPAMPDAPAILVSRQPGAIGTISRRSRRR
jgi:DNA-binding winged helix-turn-helix (wHTH) protein